MNTINFKSFTRGIGLVEVIAALGISIVVITALVSLSLFTIRTSLRSRLTLKGAEIASKELELVRAFRDWNTWANFVSAMQQCDDPTSSKCSVSSSGGGFSVIVNPDVSDSDGVAVYFKAIDPIVGDITGDTTAIETTDPVIRIAVTAEWNVAGPRTTSVYTDLTNWQGK